MEMSPKMSLKTGDLEENSPTPQEIFVRLTSIALIWCVALIPAHNFLSVGCGEGAALIIYELRSSSLMINFLLTLHLMSPTPRKINKHEMLF